MLALTGCDRVFGLPRHDGAGREEHAEKGDGHHVTDRERQQQRQQQADRGVRLPDPPQHDVSRRRPLAVGGGERGGGNREQAAEKVATSAAIIARVPGTGTGRSAARISASRSVPRCRPCRARRAPRSRRGTACSPKPPNTLIDARVKCLESGRLLAERTGLEPAASGVTGRRYNRLNYRSRTSVFNVGGAGFEPATTAL